MADATPQPSAIPPASTTPQPSATQPANGTLPQGAQVVEDDKSVFSYQEIANLVLIKKADPVFQAALDEWEKRVKVLGARLNERKSQGEQLKNEIYSIVGFFFVFLGVVLTAVSQLAANQTSGSTPLCGKIWSPILLTGLGLLFTCIGVVYKFMRLQELELSIHSGQQARAEVERRELTLRRKGPERFRFKSDASDLEEGKKPKTFGLGAIFVISSIFFITATFILSYFVILCDYWVIRGWNRS